MTIQRTRLDRCGTKDCPWRDDYDFHQIPWCQGLPGEHFKVVTHQHWPKRSQGGKEIVALLCWDCHDRIDNRDWGNAVHEEKGQRVYKIWDLHGEVLYARVIGAVQKETRNADSEKSGRPSGAHARRLGSASRGRGIERDGVGAEGQGDAEGSQAGAPSTHPVEGSQPVIPEVADELLQHPAVGERVIGAVHG